MFFRFAFSFFLLHLYGNSLFSTQISFNSCESNEECNRRAVIEIKQEFEPMRFTTYFPTWENRLSIVRINFIHTKQLQFCSNCNSGVAPGIFRRGADSSDEGAKKWFSGYYKCQKSSKKIDIHLPTGG